MKEWLLMLGIFFGACFVGQGAEPKVVFEDSLKGKLGEGWTWLRENPKGWRHSPKGLEILAGPEGKDTVKNALLRKAPDRSTGKYAIGVTVEFLTPPTMKYEQAGLTWYQGEKAVGKLVHEFIDGKPYAVTNFPPKVGKKSAENPLIELSLIVTKDRYTGAFFQGHPPETGFFQVMTIGSGNLPAGGDEKISIQCYNGPANAEHWMRFSDFRIVKLPE